MKKFFTVVSVSLISFFLLVTPSFAQSQTVRDVATGIGTVGGLIGAVTQTIVKALGTLLLSAGVVAFFYGIVQYIWGLRQGDAGKTKIGNQFMGWGLLGLFVMFSVYGIIKFGQGVLFQNIDMTKITIPELDFMKGSNSNTNLGPSGPLPTNTNTQTNDPFGTSVNTPFGMFDLGSSRSAGSGAAQNSGSAGSGSGAAQNSRSTGAGTQVNYPSGSTYGAQDITPTGPGYDTGGWKYFSDGTAISPNGTYYKDGEPIPGTGTNKGLGYACVFDSECSSGFCDQADNTCSSPASGGSSSGGQTLTCPEGTTSNGSECVPDPAPATDGGSSSGGQDPAPATEEPVDWTTFFYP